MTKKRVVLTVMAMITCGLLAACSKKEGGTAGTVISQDMKPGCKSGEHGSGKR